MGRWLAGLKTQVFLDPQDKGFFRLVKIQGQNLLVTLYFFQGDFFPLEAPVQGLPKGIV